MASYVENKKARFDYTILEEYEAGIELLGFEVKSIKNGKANLSASFAIVRGGEIYVMGLKIDPYQVNNTKEGYEPDHTRKLLLNKKEILELKKYDETKGLTLIPISLYNKNGKIKLRLAVCKGKKSFDKREVIKKRDTDREMRRELK